MDGGDGPAVGWVAEGRRASVKSPGTPLELTIGAIVSDSERDERRREVTRGYERIQENEKGDERNRDTEGDGKADEQRRADISHDLDRDTVSGPFRLTSDYGQRVQLMGLDDMFKPPLTTATPGTNAQSHGHVRRADNSSYRVWVPAYASLYRIIKSKMIQRHSYLKLQAMHAMRCWYVRMFGCSGICIRA